MTKKNLIEDWGEIPIEDWGQDHQTLLMYVESRCTDNSGVPDNRHLRPVGNDTRLPGGKVLAEHSDSDCLDDFEAAGLLIRHGTGINPVFELTDAGWEQAWKLRRARADRIRKKTLD
jgi:hypothetical protein